VISLPKQPSSAPSWSCQPLLCCYRKAYYSTDVEWPSHECRRTSPFLRHVQSIRINSTSCISSNESLPSLKGVVLCASPQVNAVRPFSYHVYHYAHGHSHSINLPSYSHSYIRLLKASRVQH
jgi:hypothetical protein